MSQNNATIIDANGCILGRLANQVAKRLINGETIHVVNSEGAIITGTTKDMIKNRYKQRYQLGTYRKGPFMGRMPHDLFKRTVRGMIPYQQPSGRAAFKRLKCHIGVPAELKGSNVETIDAARRNPSGASITIAELSRFLGANFNTEVL